MADTLGRATFRDDGPASESSGRRAKLNGGVGGVLRQGHQKRHLRTSGHWSEVFGFVRGGGVLLLLGFVFQDCWEVAVEQVVVDGFVVAVGDLVVVEVDLVEDGLVQVTAGVVGGCEVLLLFVVEGGETLVWLTVPTELTPSLLASRGNDVGNNHCFIKEVC